MRKVYTIFELSGKLPVGLWPTATAVAQMLLLSCDPTVNTPCQKWPGVFFVLVAPIGQGLSAIQQRKTLNGANPFPPTSTLYTLSSVGQRVILNFLKIYGGRCDYHEGGDVCGTQTGGFEVSAVLSITEVLRTGGE
jgi:hypothetical protein